MKKIPMACLQSDETGLIFLSKVLAFGIAMISATLLLVVPRFGLLVLVLGLLPTLRTHLALLARRNRSIPTSLTTYAGMLLSSVGFTAVWTVSCVLIVAGIFFLCHLLAGLASLHRIRAPWLMVNSWYLVRPFVGLALVMLSVVMILIRWQVDTTIE